MFWTDQRASVYILDSFLIISHMFITLIMIFLKSIHWWFFSQLSFDLLESWLARNPDIVGLKKNGGSSVFRELALFQDYHGLPAFKNVSFYIDLRKKRNDIHLKIYPNYSQEGIQMDPTKKRFWEFGTNFGNR